MDDRLRRAERVLRANGWNEDAFNVYMRGMQRSGIPMCHCENSNCLDVHVYDPKYGAPPIRLGGNWVPGVRIDDDPTNVGFCINPADPEVRTEYVPVCKECAKNLPEEFHMDGCKCDNCAVEDQVEEYTPETIAKMMGDDDEPDPTAEGWYEDWESDEFE